MRINPRANTPDMEATLFGRNQSWNRILLPSHGLSCSIKDTVLTIPGTLGVPLSHQFLCGMGGETKPITNETFTPNGPYTTKSAISNNSLPHTRISRGVTHRSILKPQIFKVFQSFSNFWFKPIWLILKCCFLGILKILPIRPYSGLKSRLFDNYRSPSYFY